MSDHRCPAFTCPRCAPDAAEREMRQLRAENDRLRDRLQISPQGDDLIDALQSAVDGLRARLSDIQKENETLYKDRNEAFKLWDDHKAENAALQVHAKRLQKSYVESLNSANEQFASAKAALESKLVTATEALEFYARARPQKVFTDAALAEVPLSDYVRQCRERPEIQIKEDGGQIAREALSELKGECRADTNSVQTPEPRPDTSSIVKLVKSLRERNPQDEEDYGYNHAIDDVLAALKEESEKDIIPCICDLHRNPMCRRHGVGTEKATKHIECEGESRGNAEYKAGDAETGSAK
jgi:DNA repair exonuclease SbcCD ATPase subunit